MKKIFLLLLILSVQLFSVEPSPVLDQEVRGINLQQLEYKKISNTNESLKNQKIESTNMEIVSDTLKRQKQRIKIVQTDSISLSEEVKKGKKRGFLGLFQK